MTQDETLRAVESLIQARFPTVVVEAAEPFRVADAWWDLNAFAVPLGRVSEFIEFAIDELPELCEDGGLPLVGMAPFSVEDALTHYPVAFKRILDRQMECLLAGAPRSEIPAQRGRLWRRPAPSSASLELDWLGRAA